MTLWVMMPGSVLMMMVMRWNQMAIIVFISVVSSGLTASRQAHMRYLTKNLIWYLQVLTSSNLFFSLCPHPQCLFRTLPWGRLSGVRLFRTSSCLTASLCPSHFMRPSTLASSRHPSTSSHRTGLNKLTDNCTFSLLVKSDLSLYFSKCTL